MDAPDLPELSKDERARHEWQMWSPGVGEEGQRRLKAATVLVSRVGGVGGAAAQQLAAAGVGRLILVHGGNLKPSDLNRQVLMKHAALGTSRVACAAARLRELNPSLVIDEVACHPSPDVLSYWTQGISAIVSAAPLFRERHALHAAAEQAGCPCVEAAMYDFEGYVTTVHPPRTPRFSDWCPPDPPGWTRQFPVFGAVAGVAGCLAAAEVVKLITGVGEPLFGRMLAFDLRAGCFRQVSLPRQG